MQVQSLDGEDPLEKGMASHSRFLPGKFHEQRSLVGYSPRGRKDSDRNERLNTRMHAHTHTHTHMLLWDSGADLAGGGAQAVMSDGEQL